MDNRQIIHESVVRDVVDVLTSAKDFDEVQFIVNSSNNRSFKSISSATKDLILTFPMLASADLNPESVSMAAKAHEKKCAAMLHILFTAICVNSNEDVYDYVRKFHTNVGTLNTTIDDYSDALDKIASMSEGCSEEYMKIDHDVLNTVLEELKHSNYTLPDDINESSINDYKIVSSTGRSIVVNEATPPTPNQQNSFRNMLRDMEDNISSMKDQFRDIANSASRERIKTSLDAAKARKERSLVVRDSIINAEYKKANELMPTMMVINFMTKGENGTISEATSVIGIKVKVYPVTENDIINQLSNKINTKNVLTNFVRATTNEIGFFKDFLFAIDKAKTDARAYGKDATSNKLWKVLERRSVKSKIRRSLKMYNDATAITTLCISDQIAQSLKEYHGIDLYNISTARKLLDSFNFMCICILNESVEVASFLYDSGEDNYERLTFSNMEREASDNSYKKIVNLLTKVSR